MWTQFKKCVEDKIGRLSMSVCPLRRKSSLCQKIAKFDQKCPNAQGIQNRGLKTVVISEAFYSTGSLRTIYCDIFMIGCWLSRG